MEPLLGGELYDRLGAQPEGRFSEPDAAQILWQVVSAVAYLHEEGIIHRDLKLENYVFSYRTSNELKLIDLGLSHRLSHGEKTLRSVVGTPYYITPEILQVAQDGSALLSIHSRRRHSLLSIYSIYIIRSMRRGLLTEIAILLNDY